MKIIYKFVFIIGMGASFSANAWFFFWLPTGALGGSSTGSGGSNCVGSTVRVGDSVIYNGQRMKVVSLSGVSSGCSDPSMPIRASLVVDATPIQAATTQAKLELPDSWVQTPMPASMRAAYGIMMATNTSINSSLQLFSIQNNKVTDPNIENWVNSMMMRQYATLGNPTRTPINKVVINGSQAWQSEVEGDNKDGGRFTHLKTIYTGQNEMVLLSIDTEASNFPQHREELYKIAASMTGLTPQTKIDSVVGGNFSSNSSLTGKSSPVQSSTDATKRLINLKSMLDKGLITQQDYDAKKAEILKSF
jgi:Short C-terminal domain